MMTKKPNFTLSIVAVTLSLLSACVTPPQRDPAFAPVAPADLRPPVQSSGSIYQAGYDMRLFEDHTAKRVGDVLTITLLERTQAQKTDDFDAKKNTAMSAEVPSMFGIAASALTGQSVRTTLASKKEFTGTGSADQSNSLTGDISVTVVSVLPNGNLSVRGEKRVTLNQGDEFVRLSGIVRPVDINAANIITSDKVADVTIMYVGEGAIADASKMGWLARILQSPWFPF
ncbi:flagellar basal body L-ring protein FlgH [Methylobacter sp. Wu8]|uniref:Flagellar L-ring protein n=1 Tax=Methylobacter tundripaludum TaxID=173365 RepID=A0A2S6H321_9GAMM|nr:flagellar basal body L-ring protein FlgH [Methylobacter tundripaludum]PPK71831.1 flagellar L-ring protein precursor FlgH [Methylobacter tundripaludum]